MPDEAENEIDELPSDAGRSSSVVGVKTIGAWTGSSSLLSDATMQRDVSFCKSTGIKSVSIMINEFSKARSARSFSTYTPGKIVRFAALLHAAEIDVTLTSWIMPHKSFLDGAARTLPELLADCRARALEWDAEEPWTQAIQPPPYDEAAAQVRDAFGATRMGVTAIGYASKEKIGPLAEICDYVVPQIYTTSTSKLDPDTDIELIAKNYREMFGHKNTIVGLAAYRQSGIHGHTIESALRTSFKHTHGLGYVRAVCYWSLGEIRRSPLITRVIKSLVSPRVAPQPTIAASVGTGATNDKADVVVVQTLLEAHDYDPGVVDGIAGAKTIAAIRAFQSTFMAKPDGRVDPGGATFRALIES